MNFYDLQHQILKGTANGKTIWQPRNNCWYEDREYTNQPLPPAIPGLIEKGCTKNWVCPTGYTSLMPASKRCWMIPSALRGRK